MIGPSVYRGGPFFCPIYQTLNGVFCQIALLLPFFLNSFNFAIPYMKLIRLVPAVVLIVLIAASCTNYNKIFKSKDYEYKLKMADEFFCKEKYKTAQQLYEELFPVFKGTAKFEELYYKDAYCFIIWRITCRHRPCLKVSWKYFPNSSKGRGSGLYACILFLQAIAQTGTGTGEYHQGHQDDADIH